MKIIDVNFDKLNRVVHLADIHIRLFKDMLNIKDPLENSIGN